MAQQSSRSDAWRLNPRRLLTVLNRKVHNRRPLLYAFPGSLIVAYRKLPKEFVLRHLQQMLPFQTRWVLRYWLHRMEEVQLIERVSRKTYRRLYSSWAEWVRDYLTREIERLESD